MGIIPGFENLTEKVVDQGACTGCGACVISCQYQDVIEYSEGKPKSIGECQLCGFCTHVCPRYALQRNELEHFIFGRERKLEEDFGIYREIYVAKSTDNKVLKRCQDGGVATALINMALDSDIIDGAIISGVDPSIPWLPMPFFSTNIDETIHYAGTRYTYSPNLLALGKNADEFTRLAFVGTPCQIRALRQMEKILYCIRPDLEKKTYYLAFTVGLFCSESFTYEGLMVKKIQNEMGINLNDIEKINIKGGMLLTLKNGKIVKIPLKDVTPYAEEKCKYCEDFSAELADISLGGVGLDGRTFAVIRTKQGETIFNHAINKKKLNIKPIEEFKRAYNLLLRLSKHKQSKAQKIEERPITAKN